MPNTAQHSATLCPSRDELLAFNSGNLAPRDIETVGSHLATCQACLAFLDSQNHGKAPASIAEGESDKSSMLDDTAVQKIQKDPQFQQLVALVKRIEFSDDRDTKTWIPLEDQPAKKSAEERAAEKMPEKIGPYFIAKWLGNGTFANVYLAPDPKETNRQVAIKVPRKLKGEQQVKDFLVEAQKAATLVHPNIVRVFDFGRLPDGGCYVVMNYIEGRSLEAAMESERFSFKQISELCAQIADALEYVHQKGFVHRDIKPANILLDQQGRPYVADFGLAIHEENQHQYKDQRAGTWPYMSPEQVRGESDFLDGRSDVWSLGVILYELLTRHKPFSSKDKSVLEDQIQHREPIAPRSYDRQIPGELERICIKCLEKSVGVRCPSAADLAELLRNPIQPSAEPVQIPSSVPAHWSRRAFWIAGGTCAAAGVGFGILTGMGWNPFRHARRGWEPNHWYLLLDRPPELLFESKIASDTKWYYDPKTQESLINSTHPVGLSVGEAQGDDFCIEVRIEKSQWQGIAGIVWGGHPGKSESGLPAQCCQMLAVHSFVDRGIVKHRLERAMLTIWTPQNGSAPLQDRANYLVAEVAAPNSPKILLEMTVVAGQVRDVLWNGVHLPKLYDRPDLVPPSPLVSRGELGLYNASGSTIFRDVRILPLPTPNP